MRRCFLIIVLSLLALIYSEAKIVNADMSKMLNVGSMLKKKVAVIPDPGKSYKFTYKCTFNYKSAKKRLYIADNNKLYNYLGGKSLGKKVKPSKKNKDDCIIAMKENSNKKKWCVKSDYSVYRITKSDDLEETNHSCEKL